MGAFLPISGALLCAAVSLAIPARAQTPVPGASEPERYVMAPTEGGFLRLDTRSGSVSFCTVETGHSLCRASADEKSALEAEISRLRRENAELKSGLSGTSTAQPKGSSNLPSEEELERALAMTERFLRRMLKVFREEAPGDKYPR
jgi:hypothetical protein